MSDKSPGWAHWVWLAAGLLSASCDTFEQGGTAVAPERVAVATPAHEQPALAALDPNDPAQAAIAQWHRALVDADFASYLEVEAHPDGKVDVDMSRVFFDALRPGVPSEILASDDTGVVEGLMSAEARKTQAGHRDFMLAGCLSTPTAAPARYIAAVTARKIAGHWKVFGGSFVPANEWFAGDCPIAERR